MKEISTLEMSHEEWLQDRRKGIGGSDVAAILGLSKWRSPYQVWLDKTGQMNFDNEESEPAYWGNVLEEVVAKEFTARTGIKARRRNRVFQHKKYPFLRANIDRDIVGENAILECKTANSFLLKEWQAEEIPTSYLCQVQHYMNVLEADYAYIAVLVGGQKFICKRIERDQELIDLITRELVEFWQVNVMQMVAPEIDGSEATTDFIKELYNEEGSKEIQLGRNIDDLVKSRIELKKEEKRLKTELNRIENSIKNELGKKDASIGITPNFVISWKSSERKSLDRKVLEEKYPYVAKDESIYKITSTRTLREKEIG